MNNANIIEVLCVDDEKSFLQLEKDFLERCGFIAVDTADSVPAALEKMKLNRYDAIVSDYQMPGPNGIDLLRFIRGQDDVTPFILFTGRGENEVAIEALSEGATFYVEKGCNPQSLFIELIDMIKSSVEHSRISSHGQAPNDKTAYLRANGDDIVMILDGKGRIISCNDRSETMTGYSKSEMIGRSITEFVALGNAQPRLDFEDPSLGRELGLDCEVRLIRKDCGELRAIVSSATIRHQSNSRLGESIWVIRDLSREDKVRHEDG